MGKDIAMQTRCVYCGAEQYGPAVWDISHGEHPCVWCGKTPPVLTEAEWLRAIRQDYQANDKLGRKLAPKSKRLQKGE